MSGIIRNFAQHYYATNMTDNEKIIIKAINYEIVITAGEDGVHALLTADDLLAAMAVPVTQYDFTYADRSKLKKLFLAVERFMRSSKLNVNSYTKAGLQTKFETIWTPTLSQEEKQELIADFRIVDGFDEEGYAVFNENTFITWKGLFEEKKNIPDLKYKTPQFGKSSSYVELIDDRPFTIYHHTDIDGFKELALPITEDEWCKIIKNASGSIKRMLQCYLQAGRGQRYTLAQMEDMFGVKADSLTGALVALGRRAQNMLNFAVIDEDEPDVRHFWSTPTIRARKENGLWVWELRPELMDAAEKILREEKYPEVKRL